MYGSKIDNLIKLRDNGFNVPAFTVVPFDDAVREDLDIKFPSDGTLFSVRSSANVEDGSEHSFAGQFETFLNVPEEEVLNRIKDIVSSAQNESVKAYSGEGQKDIRMNIIVQDMVDSEISGVIFTSNPQGILNESVITAGRGLGEGVVQSLVDTTSYYYNTTDKIFYYEGKEDLLSPDMIEDLIEQSVRMKDLFGEYLDIEFAIKDDKIYFLQVRPITTLKTDDVLIMDNSNIVESYPGISLPLTTSFVDLVYSGVFKGV